MASSSLAGPIPPWDFQGACQRVVSQLHVQLGFALWMVTRLIGDDWVVVSVLDTTYGITEGDSFDWAELFCARMVADDGPRVVPNCFDDQVYADATIAQRLTIGAYMGVPIRSTDGELFGTLSALDPSPQPQEVALALPLVELLADLLSSTLNLELEADVAQRNAEEARTQAERDALTGVLNRAGWQQVLEREALRCRRYGHGAAIVVVDLDDLKSTNDQHGHACGDVLLQKLAESMQAVARGSDVVARLGGDEFALLAVETVAGTAEELCSRLINEFEAREVIASVGGVDCPPGGDLHAAAHQADIAMYDRKQSALPAERRGCLLDAVNFLVGVAQMAQSRGRQDPRRPLGRRRP